MGQFTATAKPQGQAAGRFPRMEPSPPPPEWLLLVCNLTLGSQQHSATGGDGSRTDEVWGLHAHNIQPGDREEARLLSQRL